MPLILVGLAALGVGFFGGSQVDDAIEVATGEKDSFPILQIILLIGVGVFMWWASRKVINA